MTLVRSYVCTHNNVAVCLGILREEKAAPKGVFPIRRGPHHFQNVCMCAAYRCADFQETQKKEKCPAAHVETLCAEMKKPPISQRFVDGLEMLGLESAEEADHASYCPDEPVYEHPRCHLAFL